MAGSAAARGMTDPAIYAGRIGHVRHVAPQRHFNYRIWMLAIDLDDIDGFAKRSRLFRHNRSGLVSLQDRDHGPRDGSKLRPWVEDALAENGLSAFAARIRFMTIPRILGYAFNPISFYFCHDAQGRLGAVLHQVKNTFGDQVGYLIPVTDEMTVRQTAAKAMHVSPLFDMEGGYDFTFTRPGKRFAMKIRYGADTPRLTATMALRRGAADDRALLRQVLRMPFVTFRIFAAIHWQAVVTLLRGATFHREPKNGHAPIVRGDAA